MGSNLSPMGKESVWDMLSALEKGEFVLDLEAACHEAVQSAIEHGKGSSVTVTISFRPDPRLGAMRVGGDIKKKLPSKTTKEGLFFPTPEGNLSRYDAKQPDMFHNKAATIINSEDDDNEGDDDND